jgi:hypothetical protein
MYRLITMFCGIALFLFSCKHKEIDKCKFESIKTLFLSPAGDGEKVTGYTHYVSLKQFNRSCVDSSELVRIALAYVDTVRIGIPANVIKFYSLDPKMNEDNVGKEFEDMENYSLGTLVLDLKNRKAESFNF